MCSPFYQFLKSLAFSSNSTEISLPFIQCFVEFVSDSKSCNYPPLMPHCVYNLLISIGSDHSLGWLYTIKFLAERFFTQYCICGKVPRLNCSTKILVPVKKCFLKSVFSCFFFFLESLAEILLENKTSLYF